MSESVPMPISRAEAVCTANGEYPYDDITFGLSMHDWVQKLHEHNCKANGWKFAPLKRGAFGYDNLAMSVGATFIDDRSMVFIDDRFCTPVKCGRACIEEKESDVARAVHEGWARNYIYWRDKTPWNDTNYVYIKPYQELGDDRRNLCAVQKYAELPEEERVKDDIIARCIIDIFVEHDENTNI